MNGVTIADGMVEKPNPQDAPLREAVSGRYILAPQIFEALRHQPRGAGGEIQLMDAIAASAGEAGFPGFRFADTCFDRGSKVGMLEAVWHMATQDPELAPVLAAHARRPSVTRNAA